MRAGPVDDLLVAALSFIVSGVLVEAPVLRLPPLVEGHRLEDDRRSIAAPVAVDAKEDSGDPILVYCGMRDATNVVIRGNPLVEVTAGNYRAANQFVEVSRYHWKFTGRSSRPGQTFPSLQYALLLLDSHLWLYRRISTIVHVR
jgi:hypothetical protein